MDNPAEDFNEENYEGISDEDFGDRCPDCKAELYLYQGFLTCRRCGYDNRGKVRKFISSLWNLVINSIAVRSRVYKRLEQNYGIPELKEELTNTLAQLEAAHHYHQETLGELHDARAITKHEKALRKLAEEKMADAVQETAVLRAKVAVSIPIYALFNMINNSQSAALYANSDDYILFANREASGRLMHEAKAKRVAGASMLELASQEFVGRLKEDIKSSREGFQIEYSGCSSPFQGWHVGIARDKGELYGYLMTSDIGLIKKVFSLLYHAGGGINRVLKRRSKIIVPGQYTPELLNDN